MPSREECLTFAQYYALSYECIVYIFFQLFDRETCTYTYILADTDTKEAIVIDPVIELADRDKAQCDECGLKLIKACKLRDSRWQRHRRT